MRALVIDAALARVSVAIWDGEAIIACRQIDGARGQVARLAGMVQEVCTESGLAPAALDLIAVTVGPGSFTGLRAALALAHGIALAADRPVIGVTTAEALAEAAGPCDGRAIWVAIDSRRGRFFLASNGGIAPCTLESLPRPTGPLAIAGDAAIPVTARLAARGADVMLADARLPDPAAIARVALRRHAGSLPPLPPQPLYVDPPEAKLPAGGLRPPPLPAA